MPLLWCAFAHRNSVQECVANVLQVPDEFAAHTLELRRLTELNKQLQTQVLDLRTKWQLVCDVCALGVTVVCDACSLYLTVVCSARAS